MPNIMLTAQFRNAEFASSEREQGLEKLRSLGTIIPEPAVLTAEHAPDLIASIASSSVYTDEFYEAAEDLRIVARWGVGFDKVNVPGSYPLRRNHHRDTGSHGRGRRIRHRPVDGHPQAGLYPQSPLPPRRFLHHPHL